MKSAFDLWDLFDKVAPRFLLIVDGFQKSEWEITEPELRSNALENLKIEGLQKDKNNNHSTIKLMESMGQRISSSATDTKRRIFKTLKLLDIPRKSSLK